MAGGSIELSGLTKRFSEIAVDNVDLTVASGEFFSLLGPSGCGKTTTLRLIAGFEQPTSGRILLDGVDVSNAPPHRRNVNTAKFIVNQAVADEGKRDLARCADMVKRCFASKDYIEGRRAFMEKRKPAFTGA